MIIKLNGTEFDAVNIDNSLIKQITKHDMLAGNVRVQEGVETSREFSISFVRLFENKLEELRNIFEQSGTVILLLDTDSFSTEHTIKCDSPLKYKLSRTYPGCYEATIKCFEVS
jgi:hypothetical protein